MQGLNNYFNPYNSSGAYRTFTRRPYWIYDHAWSIVSMYIIVVLVMIILLHYEFEKGSPEYIITIICVILVGSGFTLWIFYMNNSLWAGSSNTNTNNNNNANNNNNSNTVNPTFNITVPTAPQLPYQQEGAYNPSAGMRQRPSAPPPYDTNEGM